MPVTTSHPDYNKALPKWQKCRTCYDGEEAVKDAGETYLPRLSQQEAGEYSSYKMRATFFSATMRTVQGLAGMAFRKAPAIKFPEGQKDSLATIGLSGESLTTMVRMGLEEVLTVGRTAYYVDAGDGDGSEPYLVQYYAENVVNWRTRLIGDQQELELVVIRETVYEQNPSDEFKQDPVPQYRVLRLDDSLRYSVTIYRQVTKNDNPNSTEQEWAQFGDVIFPAGVGGRSFDRIPFTFVSTADLSADVEKPPLLDLVNINLSHYRTSADLEHGRHFTALPTAWVAGFDTQTNKLYIGSSVAWVSANPDAKAGFLEFTGAGLGHLKDAMTHKEAQMAVLGSRLLEETKQQVEATDTVAMRQSAEGSVLSGIVQALSDGITKVLEWYAEWLGLLGEDISYQLSQEFTSVRMDAPTLTSLLASLQAGKISYDTWFFNLQRGDMVPDGRTAKEEQQLIEADGPPQPPVPGSGDRFQKPGGGGTPPIPATEKQPVEKQPGQEVPNKAAA